MKAKQVKVEVKEIRFGPQTDEHDYQFKLKHAKEFLEEGNKVRAYVFFRGRSILFKEQGEVLLLRFANDLEEVGKVESMPSLEGLLRRPEPRSRVSRPVTVRLQWPKPAKPRKSSRLLRQSRILRCPPTVVFSPMPRSLLML